MNDNEGGPGPVLPPSRFGAGFSVGRPEAQPSYPPVAQPGYPPAAFSAPEPPPPGQSYQAPVVGVPVQYPVMMPVGYIPAQKTNGLAIAALVCPLVFCVLFPLGIIFGHIALSQISRTGEDGRGLAIAGLVISYVIAAVVLVVFVSPDFLYSLGI